jgi:hypothetical protein
MAAANPVRDARTLLDTRMLRESNRFVAAFPAAHEATANKAG